MESSHEEATREEKQPVQLRRVLLVQSLLGARNLVRELETLDQSLTIDSGETVDEGLQKLEEATKAGTPYDLMLVASDLPQGQNGFEVTMRKQVLSPTTYVGMTSTNAASMRKEYSEVRGKELGINEIVDVHDYARELPHVLRHAKMFKFQSTGRRTA